ncbi:hypothetical protein GO684_04880 [Wolbachia endosymbiont of Litomosoides brasiliensis]|uniref:hypothetical protein n=1 Tax=Wolbachia endosymbiont of Litomosoides brasiliensis TaxID=1812117 RepID=UPI0015893B3B|nr:hypothetical protein [Wolbachia endosymbiont of Litomosoides brasiliensis]NUY39928.1 hypothetical protein [Wolbachia endosymbiont of Litomosoides brasiliensis]
MDQISDIAEFFNCRARKRGHKFVQSVLKQGNCIIDFVTQNVLFYMQPKSLNRVGLGGMVVGI